jgi:hypothetical protein
VVRRAGGHDHDAAQVAQLLLGHAEALEHELPVAYAVTEGFRDGLRLLVDLLEHERLVPALLSGLHVPVDLDHLALELAVLHADEAGAVGRDRDDLAVLDQLDRPGLVDKCRGHRGEEHLALADAHEQRALEPRADELFRVVVVDDDEREMALELAVSLARRLEQIAPVVTLDQVHDHLGVGLGAEGMALGLERSLQLAVVLHDSVQDDRELALVAPGERVRVLHVHRAMGRPACMAEARRRLRAIRAGFRLQHLEIADGAHIVDLAVLPQREPGRVVTAVLEALETLEQKVLTGSLPDVSDDPAHAETPLRTRKARPLFRPCVGRISRALE